MNGDENLNSPQEISEPQCQFFVQRKKRLCRMTVKPGKNFCGEHEPAPPEAGEQDLRVPCPLDPKHTCYASKLEKHVQVCNSRRGTPPDYYEHNVNAAEGSGPAPARLPLPQVPREQLERVVEKINHLYESVVEHEISPLAEEEPAIHPAVLSEFCLPERTESSRRHLRQASALLRLCEDEGLAEDDTCYVELGAGKGHLSYFAWLAWCSRQPRSRALLLDRAALRHKRDNKLRAATTGGGDATYYATATEPSVSVDDTAASRVPVEAPVRLRADLAHVALQRVPCVEQCRRVVGLAKHLCGVATDYALRCMTASQVVRKTRGIVVATCCHHRCERAAYIATADLMELGISGEELDVVLGVVSWATCGDGRSRARRLAKPNGGLGDEEEQDGRLTHAQREEVGRRAKALVDWGRVCALRRLGMRARLAQFVPHAVSPENIAIVAGQDVP